MICYCRYLWLDKLLPKTDFRTIIIKILADQFFAAPFFAITFFFGMGILEDKRMSECWKEFVKKFPAVYLVSKTFFLPSEFICNTYSFAYSSIGVFGHLPSTLIFP